MLRNRNQLLVAAVFGLWASAEGQARGDEFERIEGETLAAVPRSREATAHGQLTIAAIEGLPNVLRESRSAFLVATTDQGNFTRMLVSPALRKPPGSSREPVPVLVVERFDTFDAGNLASRLARGKELILFDGFQIDLDTAQVVPEDQGGDLRFQVNGEGGARLLALGKARLYSLAKTPLENVPGPGRLTLGRAVRPSDFAGRYKLFANGQWSGMLDLKVDSAGAVTGRFRSDLNGAAYPVDGQVGPHVPHRVTFRVKFPRTVQEYEAFLWTEGKGALAGTLTMVDHAYGFFAIREGGRFAPEGEDVGPVIGAAQMATPGRRTVVVRNGQYTLDGQPRTDGELTESLRQALGEEPATWVLLRVGDDEPFAAIERAFEVISAAGVGTVRLGAAD